MENHKVCVSCGKFARVKPGGDISTQVYQESLYQKTGILKLLECHHCGSVIDKYVEQEGALILLDMSLQSLPAFRHILINQIDAYLPIIWKMVLSTLIVDGYCRWASIAGNKSLFDREHEFYIKFCEALISLLVYMSGILLPYGVYSTYSNQHHLLNSGLSNKIGSKNGPTSASSYCHWKKVIAGLLLSFCVRFLNLLALLWSTPDTTTFLWWFVELLFIITSVHSFQVVSELNGLQSLVLLLCAHLSRYVCQIPLLSESCQLHWLNIFN